MTLPVNHVLPVEKIAKRRVILRKSREAAALQLLCPMEWKANLPAAQRRALLKERTRGLTLHDLAATGDDRLKVRIYFTSAALK